MESKRVNMLIAIDPGKGGAIAYEIPSIGLKVDSFKVDKDGKFDEVDLSAKLRVLQQLAISANMTPICTLEHVHAMKDNGVTSSFNFGMNFGFIKGVLTALQMECHLVSPQTWKRKLGLLKTEKKVSHIYAKAAFPNMKIYIKQADAVCLLIYAKGELIE